MAADLENHPEAFDAVHPGLHPVTTGGELAGGFEVEVHAIAIAVRRRMNRIREEIVAIGRDLLRAKGILPRGRWIHWLESEVDLSLRSAENYMNVAERFGDEFASLANLRLETAYKLAARSTPDAVIEAVLARASSAEGLSDGDAAAMLPKVERALAAKPAVPDMPPDFPPSTETLAGVSGPEQEDPSPRQREPAEDLGPAASSTTEPVSPAPRTGNRQQVELATLRAFDQLKDLKPEKLRRLCPSLRVCDPANLAKMLEIALAAKTPRAES